jgi:hypothetical protein
VDFALHKAAPLPGQTTATDWVLGAFTDGQKKIRAAISLVGLGSMMPEQDQALLRAAETSNKHRPTNPRPAATGQSILKRVKLEYQYGYPGVARLMLTGFLLMMLTGEARVAKINAHRRTALPFHAHCGQDQPNPGA